MTKDYIELFRSHYADQFNDVREILDEGKIHYKLGSTGTHFDISKIGIGDDIESIISVEKQVFKQARIVLENAYTSYDLPSDHFLNDATNEDLIEIIGNEYAWSAFDVAQAKKIATSRDISIDDIEERKAKAKIDRKNGKPARAIYFIAGWTLTLIGMSAGHLLFSILGVAVGLSLTYMKTKTPEGKFWAYDASSRTHGSVISLVSGAGIALLLSGHTLITLLSK